MLDSIRKMLITALIPITGATYYAIDQAGYTWVTKNRLMHDGWYQKRDRLLDRIEDGTITPFQRGVLSGLCIALKIKQAECENRDNN